MWLIKIIPLHSFKTPPTPTNGHLLVVLTRLPRVRTLSTPPFPICVGFLHACAGFFPTYVGLLPTYAGCLPVCACRLSLGFLGSSPLGWVTQKKIKKMPSTPELAPSWTWYSIRYLYAHQLSIENFDLIPLYLMTKTWINLRLPKIEFSMISCFLFLFDHK